MKNLKFLLPMLAIIFAIGVAFTAPDSSSQEELPVQAKDYFYLGDGNWQEIPEQNCVGTAQSCKVRIGEGGPVYDVYDEMDLSKPKLAPPTHQPAVINL